MILATCQCHHILTYPQPPKVQVNFFLRGIFPKWFQSAHADDQIMSSIDLLQIFLGLETNFYIICFSWLYSLTKILRKDFFEIKF